MIVDSPQTPVFCHLVGKFSAWTSGLVILEAMSCECSHCKRLIFYWISIIVDYPDNVSAGARLVGWY